MLAPTLGALRILEAAVIAAGSLPMLAIALTGSFGTALGETLTSVHQAGFLVGQGLIISVNTIVLGLLLLKAKVVPKSTAVLGLAGGWIVLLGNCLQLMGVIEMGGPAAGLAAVPVFTFEIWFAFYLLIRGVGDAPDKQKLHWAQASASANAPGQ